MLSKSVVMSDKVSQTGMFLEILIIRLMSSFSTIVFYLPDARGILRVLMA
jgi:hypothetical protein